MAAETIIDIKASMEYDNDHIVHNNLFMLWRFTKPQ